ncbi:GNAT family N-acetyltransferase [Streptomyces sp. Da 82-17]|uniref:GNAT family N-acetyltransferase n=1 Tax=Streptomyces sp. Da 82-17 TaxID=3377116 RepID=UPI0038D511B3
MDPYRPEDEEDFVALFRQERVHRWMGDGTTSEERDRALFGRIFSKVYARRLFDVWAVRHEGRYAGHAEIKPTEESGGHEIVYALHPDAWGRGLGGELARAVLDHGFGTLGLTEVHATVAAPNEASLALLHKLGFVHVRDLAEEDGSTTRLLTLEAPRTAPRTAPRKVLPESQPEAVSEAPPV